MYERWMSHVKLPLSLIDRVRNFNEYISNKYHGLDENQILADLPSSIRSEVLEYLLHE